jgi:hypothetical protein
MGGSLGTVIYAEFQQAGKREKGRTMVEVVHNEDVRLVPLDAWERWFIKEMARQELTLAQHSPESDSVAALRLLDLLRKVDPIYPPRAYDEDGNVVDMHH